MQNFLLSLDKLAKIETEKDIARWLERLAFIFMTLMVLFAPHSIAATESAWLIGMVFWALRMIIKPHPAFVKTVLNIPLLAFIGWTIFTCFTSYAPSYSFDRLRSVSVFLAFFFLINNLRTKRAAIFLAFALIFSCMVNVAWTGYERIAGRGIEIEEIKPDSPLAKSIFAGGDTLLKANNKKISTPEELVAEVEQGGDVTNVYFYRPDFYGTIEIHKSDLLDGSSAVEKLGIEKWKHSRNWRSQGFYSHYTTYSEVLQMIASLVFGFLAALFMFRNHNKLNDKQPAADDRLSIAKYQILFAVCLSGILFALLLTTTRASQLGFIAATFAVIWLTGKRKWLLILAAILLPLAIIGFVYLQQTRRVGVIDTGDGSTKYRVMMYRDGFRLWTTSPRNFLLGLGMDSIIPYWQEWGLFDKGWQPKGHFHSTIVQVLVERGLPALLLWFWILWRYARLLVQSSKFKIQGSKNEFFDWKTVGILLGCFGGLVGYFTGGLVQNNIGDTQVATVFYILMGIATSLVVKCEWRIVS